MSTTMAGLTLTSPVMNAACSVAKSFDDLNALLATRAGAVLIGSITWLPRDGNAEPRWFPGEAENFALNSFGMPNNGHDWYAEHLPEMVKRAHAANKPLVVSVAGFSVQEYVDLAELCETAGIDMVELNLGCPNTAEAGVPNPIFSFDLDAIKSVIAGVEAVLLHTSYSLKLSPYSNPAELGRTAAVIARSTAAAVVTSNTFPNGYWQDSAGQPVIAANAGLAGTSGESMLPISLGQVRQFRSALPESIAVIGVGGITKLSDVTQYLQAGASAVQVATHIVRHGHAALNDVIETA